MVSANSRSQPARKHCWKSNLFLWHRFMWGWFVYRSVSRGRRLRELQLNLFEVVKIEHAVVAQLLCLHFELCQELFKLYDKVSFLRRLRKFKHRDHLLVVQDVDEGFIFHLGRRLGCLLILKKQSQVCYIFKRHQIDHVLERISKSIW